MPLNETLIRWASGLAICGLLVAVGFGFGINSANKKNAAMVEKQRIAYEEKLKSQAIESDKIVASYVDRIKTITKEVPVYVSPKDAKCTVFDGSFRLFHDAIVYSSMSNPTGDSDDSPATIEDIAQGVASNYSSCAQNATQLESLQAWARTVSQP